MKNFSRPCDWVVLGCLLVAIFSALPFLPMAQSSQDQNEATATLNLTANYTADYKSQNRDEVCEDHITLTYGGAARYKLLPLGYGTSNVHPEDLTDYPRAGVHTDRTGGFTVNVQGGGSCISAKGGGKTAWTYSARYNAVPPNEFPSIGVQLRPGDYRVGYEFPDSVITAQGQMSFSGGGFGRPGGAPLDTKQRPNAVAPAPASISYQAKGPAMFPLLAVMQQSIPKVSAALHGTFTPYSKQFSRSNRVSDTFQMPPNNDGQTGTASLSIFFTLTVGNPEEVEAIIIPQNGYEDWIPEAAKDEDIDGNKLDVKVVLQKKGQPGNKPEQGAQFKFELVEVSKEPGICLNWPPKAQVKNPPDFDLKFDKNNPYFASSADNGQSALSKQKLKEVLLTIISHDYGAWGKLKVTAKLEDGTSIVAHLQDKPNIEELSIPKDDNGNHVADEWEQEMGMGGGFTAESDDDSSPPGDGTTGDGLSSYEEYRGFMVKGQHIRTRPDNKDIFIHDQNGLGTGLFSMSDLTIHVVDLTEFDNEIDSETPNQFVINFNHGTAHLGAQHVLYLMQGDAGEGAEGSNWPDDLDPGPPKHVQFVSVDVESIRDEEENAEDFQAHLDSTIAHELAHGANVYHHGDSNYSICGEADAKCSLQHWDGGSWAPVGTQASSTKTIVVTGGQNSGVEECIMRYPSGSYYEAVHGGDYRWQKSVDKALTWVTGYSYGDPEKDGTIFCEEKLGTGVNAPSYRPAPKARTASRGNCKRQFCVNDTKECTKPSETTPPPDQPALQTGSFTVISSSFNPSGFSQSVAITARVTSATSIGTPSGTVIFAEASSTLDTETLGAKGQATFKTSTLSIGTHLITANYGGDSNFNSSTSPILTQVVSAISFSPMSITFPAQTVGTTSGPQSLTLTNRGNTTVTIIRMTITRMNASEFAIASTTCGGMVSAGASCEIKVTFTPTSRGQAVASLSISNTADGSPQQVSLSGTSN